MGILKAATSFGAIGIASKLLGGKKKKKSGPLNTIHERAMEVAASRRTTPAVDGLPVSTAKGPPVMRRDNPPVADSGFSGAFGSRSAEVNAELEERRRRRAKMGYGTVMDDDD